ncbi:MAG TPA: trypsin-like peptidase domain-containing protein [Ferruginibacter sp.]|nr:trypsin-like peptidase domain-containing protein [Ferruginibacter sp.]
MFQSAIEKASTFTRPLHTITRTYGGLIIPGAGTFFFVNDLGVAITCKHVVDSMIGAETLNANFEKFKAERKKLLNDNKYKNNLLGLETKYKYNKDAAVQHKNNFLNSFDEIKEITFHTHPTLDLAIIEFKGFNKILYTSHASFLRDSTKIKQGKSLCRLGFPFPEFTNFKHNPDTDDIEWTNTGIINSPSFPIDGIVTRFIADGPNNITGVEMSTPGLRGQSGCPLFDTNGVVYGMQSATKHLHLGFEIKDQEVVMDTKKMKVSNSPFLHVGVCIHVDKIKEFLKEKKISFTETD